MKNFFHSIKYILTKDISKEALFVIFLIIISALLELVGISLFIPLIIIIFEGDVKNYYLVEKLINLFEINDSKQFLIYNVSLFILVFLIKNIILTISSIKESQFVFKTKKYLSEKLLRKYILNKKNFLNKKNSSIILNILTKEISYFVHLLINLLILISESLILFSIVILMTILETKIFISVITAIVTFFLLFYLITRKKLKSLAEERLIFDTQFLKESKEIIEGSREIKIYDKSSYFLNEFYKTNNKIFNIYWRTELFQRVPKFWLEFFIIIFISILILFLNSQNYDGSFIAVKLGILGLITARLMPSSNRIFQSFQKVKIYFPSLKAIYDEIHSSENQPKEILETAENKKKLPLIFNEKISINNLTFFYEKNKKILMNFNLEIKKNSMIGIYGTNGSGKSTFLDLLFGFLTPLNGEILVDGKNISKNLNSWQKKISYLPQKVYLKDTTILENIIFDKNISDQKKLDDVFIKAGIKEMLQNLPDGANTNVGDQGKKISGGQQQKIGLARALYHNPEILVMDEATNSIDYDSSNKIIQLVKNMKNITRLIVTHDIEILNQCEQIYQIKNGTIKKIEIKNL